jgi:hypothetical protein
MCDVPGGVLCVVPGCVRGTDVSVGTGDVCGDCGVRLAGARVGSGGTLLLVVASVVLVAYVQLVQLLLEVHVACVAQMVRV